MQGLERLCAGNHFFAVTRSTMKETTATTMTAPMSDGKMAMPPSCGPQLPKSACPSADPARPAMMLAIQPIDPLRFLYGTDYDAPIEFFQAVVTNQLVHSLKSQKSLSGRNKAAGISIQPAADSRPEAPQILFP